MRQMVADRLSDRDNEACCRGIADEHEPCNTCGVLLPEYIESIGDHAAANLFGVPVRTVLSWRLKDRRPRPATAQAIVERTGGKVSLADIYATDPQQ